MSAGTKEVLDRLAILERKHDLDGTYVSANTCHLAISSIARLLCLAGETTDEGPPNWAVFCDGRSRITLAAGGEVDAITKAQAHFGESGGRWWAIQARLGA